MTEPVEVRLLFFVDRDGKPMVRVRYGAEVGRVYDAYAGAQSVVGAAVAFESQANGRKRALDVPRDAEDAYVRGFAKGFDEGVSRAEREAWEALEPYIGPPGPLDTTDRPLPANARETMTLAAALSTLLGSMVARRPSTQWTRFEALERAIEDHVTSWISVGGPRLAEALACRRAAQGARLAFEQPEGMCVVMARGPHQVRVTTPDEFCDMWRMGYR